MYKEISMLCSLQAEDSSYFFNCVLLKYPNLNSVGIILPGLSNGFFCFEAFGYSQASLGSVCNMQDSRHILKEPDNI